MDEVVAGQDKEDFYHLDEVDVLHDVGTGHQDGVDTGQDEVDVGQDKVDVHQDELDVHQDELDVHQDTVDDHQDKVDVHQDQVYVYHDENIGYPDRVDAGQDELDVAYVEMKVDQNEVDVDQDDNTGHRRDVVHIYLGVRNVEDLDDLLSNLYFVWNKPFVFRIAQEIVTAHHENTCHYILLLGEGEQLFSWSDSHDLLYLSGLYDNAISHF